MFDSKELARKALQRVEEIHKEKRRKMLSATMLSTAVCMSAAWLLVLATSAGIDDVMPYSDYPLGYVVEYCTPLEIYPAEAMEICYECGVEVYEYCEYCYDE